MNIIVTGGAGFVGSHVVEMLIKNKHFPIIIDNLNSGKYQYIKKFVMRGEAKFVKADIRDFTKLMKIPRAAAVIHLAAIASVVESINNPIMVNEVNVSGTLNMLEFCRKKKIPKFIFTSSAAIYGNYEKKISESVTPNPVTVYGFTKLAGEQLCKIYSNLYGIQTIALRPFNIYGPRQNNAYAGVISKFISRIKDNRHPIIYGNGRQTRDFIHVDDVAKAFVAAVSLKIKDKYDVFNLATGRSISINYLANLCLKESKKSNLKPMHEKAIPGLTIYNSAQVKKLYKVFGFVPRIRLDEGITTLLGK